MSAWYSILTPNDRAGAVAMIQIGDVDQNQLGLPSVDAGRLVHADLFGLDDGVVLGYEDGSVVLMPHGGVAIIRSICDVLEARGVTRSQSPEPSVVFPEAANEIEAWCLHALSVASSDAAVDVLLEHSARWQALEIETCAQADSYSDMSSEGFLDRLIQPSTVVAVGRANVGKSSLLNSLVGQHVALVADVAGTTRDHVGVPVDLGGLVVRWIDTPGVDERIETRDEIMIAKRVVAHADLVVHCIDALDDPGMLDPRIANAVPKDSKVVRVGMRSDLGEHQVPVDVRVSVGDAGQGMGELVKTINEQLVPIHAYEDMRPWRFWRTLQLAQDRGR